MKSYLNDSNLVFWYPFNVGSGTSLYDISGNSHTGTLTNTPTWQKNNFNGTYYLDFSSASSEYVDVGNDISESDNVGTILAWIKVNDATNVNPIYVQTVTVGGDLISFQQYNESLYYQFFTGGTNTPLLHGGTILDDTWHFVAVTSNGSALSLYIDGESQSITVDAGSNDGKWFNDLTGTHDCYIGRKTYSGGSNYFDGSIDLLMRFSRTLSEEEIKDIYRKTYRE